MSARREGFSLIEVLLAMTILLGAIIVLGELARLGRRNATGARDWTRAELLGQSLLDEIATGSRPAEPVEDAPLEDEPGWLYSVELTPTDEPGLVAVEVTVSQDLPKEKKPVHFMLVRWIPQPEFATGPAEHANGEASQPALSPAP